MDGNLKFVLMSDLHIKEYANVLEPMVDAINSCDVDLVVVTGDLTHKPSQTLFDIALTSLNKIKHNVIVIPGDYDCGPLWTQNFGDTYKSLSLKGFDLDFLDTSYLGHRYATGWGETLSEESPDQHDWLISRLQKNIGKSHIIFSHHPLLVPKQEVNKSKVYLTNNVRAIYSGHLHTPFMQSFDYSLVIGSMKNGILTTPMRYHGNSLFMVVEMSLHGDIRHTPMLIDVKVEHVL